MDVDPNYDPSDFLLNRPARERPVDEVDDSNAINYDGLETGDAIIEPIEDAKIKLDLEVSESEDEGVAPTEFDQQQQQQQQQNQDGDDDDGLWF